MARNVFFFIQFLLVALSILFLSHYFIYFSIVHFFSVTGSSRRLVLAGGLFVLAISFIPSMILLQRFEGPVSTAVYFCSTLWLGVGLTMISFFALAWAARGVTRLFTHSPSPAIFGAAALILTGLFTAYGMWNATHVRTERVTVKIPNLPPEWRGRKAVQLSDVHLGRIFGASFLEKLVERTNAEQPAAVFITGDLFDGRDGHLDKLVAPLSKLHAPLGIYFVTGNHETYLGTERAEAALKTTPVRMLKDEMVVADGLQIIGIGYAERGASKNLGEIIRKIPGFDPGKASVLLYHSPAQIERVKAAGIGLQLSGHTHHGQIFPLQFVTRMIYGKYYNGLHTEGGYTIYTSSGAGVWGPTMRTGSHPEITVLRFE